jgi:hypothetical protein
MVSTCRLGVKATLRLSQGSGFRLGASVIFQRNLHAQLPCGVISTVRQAPLEASFLDDSKADPLSAMLPKQAVASCEWGRRASYGSGGAEHGLQSCIRIFYPISKDRHTDPLRRFAMDPILASPSKYTPDVASRAGPIVQPPVESRNFHHFLPCFLGIFVSARMTRRRATTLATHERAAADLQGGWKLQARLRRRTRKRDMLLLLESEGRRSGVGTCRESRWPAGMGNYTGGARGGWG